MTALSILVVGLLLGMQHATEADHLAAVATLATRQHSLARALRQGLAWGIGHTLTLMAFAGAVLALGRVVSPGLEQGLETAVGLMLIVLGADVLRRLWRHSVHVDPEPRSGWPLRALAIGMVHGLAGSAALVLLSLQAVPSVALGLGYIALFGAGSILGMAVLSVAIAIPMQLSATYLGRVQHAVSAAIGMSTCALGMAMVWQIGALKAWLVG